ncbi:putative alpha/beta fold family hydrolase [Aspergillus affinis]|uniref:putative alpha/beta fold family hydrolase n=1 Tax=Aspergillus affinis TaxID=1070780 RepID=UPI0022FE970A|nr:putative alpha/beta fold family hydrolase [Aspergillus affinis]KAI9045593.1 putative alpha/beta fold family hydrolase [Aspergillus affinis]
MHTSASNATSRVPLAYEVHKPKSKRSDENRPPIIFLHGFLGSKRENARVSRLLSQDLSRRVFALDLRNHGDSGHHRRHDYMEMALDVESFIKNHGFESATVIGHSMGAKTALTLALHNSDIVSDVVAVDNGPIALPIPNDFKKYMDGLEEVEQAKIRTHTEGERILAKFEESPVVRLFLLSNFIKDNHHNYLRSRLPLGTLKTALGPLGDFPKKKCDENFDSSGSCRTCVRLKLDCHAPRNAHLTAARPHNSDIVQYEHAQDVSNIFRVLPGHDPREQTSTVDFERATTSAVLLTFTDIILGGTSEWYHHLQGAIAIANGVRDKLDPRNVMFHRFLTRFLIYHDVTAAVALSTSTTLDPVFYEQEEQQTVLENLHSIAGANSMLLTLVARICRLRATTNRNTPVDFDPLYTEANDIEQKLHVAKACSSSGFLFEHLMGIYRASALCLLYRTLEKLETSAPLIDTIKIKGNVCHENLILYLESVSLGSTLGLALVFPLFIAGVGATTAGQQTFMRNQMEGLYDRLRFGNIARALLVPEDVWNSRVACERPGWTSPIQQRSWRLALA